MSKNGKCKCAKKTPLWVTAGFFKLKLRVEVEVGSRCAAVLVPGSWFLVVSGRYAT